MAEHESIPKNYKIQADDHCYQGLKAGDWLAPIPQAEPMDPAAFKVMDHELQHGLENQKQPDPALPPMEQ